MSHITQLRNPRGGKLSMEQILLSPSVVLTLALQNLRICRDRRIVEDETCSSEHGRWSDVLLVSIASYLSGARVSRGELRFQMDWVGYERCRLELSDFARRHRLAN